MPDSQALRRELIDLARAADIRFRATPEEEQRIQALAAQLEPLNPTPSPAVDGLGLLAGRWQLLYSTFPLERQATLRRLSFAKLPDVEVTVTGIFQEASADGSTYDNVVAFEHGTLRGAQRTHGTFVAEAPRRLQIHFHWASVEAVAPALDEAGLRAALGVGPDARLRADVSFDGWSDVTYLDGELRLMRGNVGNLYVLVRA